MSSSQRGTELEPEIIFVNKVRSAQVRTHDIDKILQDENIVYVSPDKARTEDMLQALGRSAPFGGGKLGSIKMIYHTDPSINNSLREDGGNDAEFSDSDVKFSLREEAPPKNTKIGYKVFYVKDGKLYPPMVANPNAEATPMGVWLNVDVGTAAAASKTGRQQVKAGGRGTQGGSGSLAFRPGWHMGEIPHASQFARLNQETGKKELFPRDFVFAEVEFAADVDCQQEAMSYGYTSGGKFQHSLAGLPRLPENGYYAYRTNPDPSTIPWFISGAIKVNRLLTDAETDVLVKKSGREPMQRQGGELNIEELGLTDDMFKAATKRGAFSMKDSEGKPYVQDQKAGCSNHLIPTRKSQVFLTFFDLYRLL